METNDQTAASGTNLMNKENLKAFYREQLPQLIKTVLLNPISGTRELLRHPSGRVYGHAILLILSTMALYFIAPYLLAGEYMRQLLSFGMLLKCSVLAGIFMLLVSAFSFGIKSISGKPSFRNELLTGALCGIGLILLLAVFVVVRIFGDRMDVYSFLNPAGLMQNVGLILVLVLYIFLYMVNIFQQSLKANGTNDALSWYVSPLAILLVFYILGKLAKELLIPASPF